MPRVKIDDVILKVADGTAPSALVEVRLRGTSTLVDVWDSPSGGAEEDNPYTVSDGRLELWVDEGSYDLYVTSPTSAFTAYIQSVELVHGDTVVTERANTPQIYSNGGTHSAGATISIAAGTHGLGTGRGKAVHVYEVATGDEVQVEKSIASNGNVTVTFTSSQSSNTHEVVIIG